MVGAARHVFIPNERENTGGTACPCDSRARDADRASVSLAARVSSIWIKYIFGDARERNVNERPSDAFHCTHGRTPGSRASPHTTRISRSLMPIFTFSRLSNGNAPLRFITAAICIYGSANVWRPSGFAYLLDALLQRLHLDLHRFGLRLARHAPRRDNIHVPLPAWRQRGRLCREGLLLDRLARLGGLASVAVELALFRPRAVGRRRRRPPPMGRRRCWPSPLTVFCLLRRLRFARGDRLCRLRWRVLGGLPLL